MAAHVEVDLPESERQAFYELVLQSLARVESDLGELLRPYLEQVVKGLEEQGVFRDLREDRDRLN
jgi:hypothetical protein